MTVMQAFEVEQLQKKQARSGRSYHEFLNVPSMSAGLYVLPAGSEDKQQPHTEDEVYYVVYGRGKIRVGDEDQDVGPTSIIYVPAGVEHRFHSIIFDLTILVFFAPAEYSQAK
jgi:mannose-6-phosphate isomerase-like protein (cupin superfamily)